MRVEECTIDMGAFKDLVVQKSQYPDGEADYVIDFSREEAAPRLSVWRRFARFMLREPRLAPAGTVSLRNISQQIADKLVAQLTRKERP